MCALKFHGEVYDHMKNNKRCFKNEFDKDNLFGHKFVYALDQHFHRFLGKYLEIDYVSDVDPFFPLM